MGFADGSFSPFQNRACRTFRQGASPRRAANAPPRESGFLERRVRVSSPRNPVLCPETLFFCVFRHVIRRIFKFLAVSPLLALLAGSSLRLDAAELDAPGPDRVFELPELIVQPDETSPFLCLLPIDEPGAELRIDGEPLRSRQLYTVEDVFRAVPGVYVRAPVGLEQLGRRRHRRCLLRSGAALAGGI